MEGVRPQSANEPRRRGCLLCPESRVPGLRKRAAAPNRDSRGQKPGRPDPTTLRALTTDTKTAPRWTVGGWGAPRALSTVPPRPAGGRCREPGAREGEGGQSAQTRPPRERARGLRLSSMPTDAHRPCSACDSAQGPRLDSLRLAQRLVPIPPFIPAPVLTSARSCLGFHITPIPNQVLRLILEGGELFFLGGAGGKVLKLTVFIGHYLPKCRSHSAVPSRPPQNLPRGRRARGSRAELLYPESPILSGVSPRAPA